MHVLDSSTGHRLIAVGACDALQPARAIARKLAKIEAVAHSKSEGRFVVVSCAESRQRATMRLQGRVGSLEGRCSRAPKQALRGTSLAFVYRSF